MFGLTSLGPTELFIILIIIVVLFGGGRVARLGSELGSGIANFRREVRKDETEAEKTDDSARR